MRQRAPISHMQNERYILRKMKTVRPYSYLHSGSMATSALRTPNVQLTQYQMF